MTAPPALDAIEHDAALLERIHRHVTELDPAAPGPEVLAQVRAALADAIAIAGRLVEQCDHGAPDLGAWGDDLEPSPAEADPAASSLADQVWQQVGNLAFAARSELRRAERFLASAPEPDQRVVACESARRKLRRAIAALLDVVGQALGREFVLTGLAAEIEAAIAVRRLYAKLRRSLPCCDPDDPGRVRRALRLAAVALAVMIGSADFGEIRAQDRQLLLRLQARVLAWAREGASESVGRQLYFDLHTTADLLRAIGRRQELIRHDHVTIARLVDDLAARREPAEALEAARPLLRALAGKDDELDLVATASAPPAAIVAQLRARLVALGWMQPIAA